jgi:hypothetical protein
MTLRELRREIDDHRPGWIRRTSCGVDELLAGPKTTVPLAMWLGLWMLAFLFAGWFDG